MKNTGKKGIEILYNIARLLLLYILFCAVLIIALPIAWNHLSFKDYLLVISFFSLLGTYFSKIEKVSSIIFFISFCMFLLIWVNG